MKHDYKLEYKNVVLKPLSVEDIEYLRVWRNDESNCTFLRKIPHITSEMQVNWFNNYLMNEDEICFSIFENEELNRIVGSASLYNFTENSVEFGKILIGDNEAHGRSIGLNTLKVLADFVFKSLKKEKIILECHVDNIAALKVYQRAGFKIIGKHPFGNDGEEYDMELVYVKEEQ